MRESVCLNHINILISRFNKPFMREKKMCSFLGIAGISLLLFLVMSWIHTFQALICGWAYSVCYFAFTWICLQVFSSKTENKYLFVISAIILGRIILEIPIRISDFGDSFATLMFPIITIISILLAAVCYYEKRVSVYVLSAIILLLVNTFVHECFLEYCSNLTGISISNL